MPAKTKRRRSRGGTTRKNSVWGKNKPLETFWRELASGKKVVLVYKNGTTKSQSLPSSRSSNIRQLASFNADSEVIAVLSSNQSQDAYEQHLYPKAKNKSVEYVVKNYTKFFTLMANKIYVPQ